MDIGSSQKDLEKQFGDKLDYSQLYEGWEIPSGKHATDTDSLLKRGQRMRAYLKERPERNIMVSAWYNVFSYHTTVLTDPLRRWSFMVHLYTTLQET